MRAPKALLSAVLLCSQHGLSGGGPAGLGLSAQILELCYGSNSDQAMIDAHNADGVLRSGTRGGDEGEEVWRSCGASEVNRVVLGPSGPRTGDEGVREALGGLGVAGDDHAEAAARHGLQHRRVPPLHCTPAVRLLLRALQALRLGLACKRRAAKHVKAQLLAVCMRRPPQGNSLHVNFSCAHECHACKMCVTIHLAACQTQLRV